MKMHFQPESLKTLTARKRPSLAEVLGVMAAISVSAVAIHLLAEGFGLIGSTEAHKTLAALAVIALLYSGWRILDWAALSLFGKHRDVTDTSIEIAIIVLWLIGIPIVIMALTSS